jgi:hypothetical protein
MKLGSGAPEKVARDIDDGYGRAMNVLETAP